jgi:hypothetical protein
VTGKTFSKLWEGGAQTFKMRVYKKDTQRATLEKSFNLPRNGESVPLNFTIELTTGHEIAFVPLMPDWHNATTTTIEQLSIQQVQ